MATESVLDVYRLLLEVLGSSGMLKEGSPGAALKGHLEHEVRLATVNTFGGGVNEVQRELVAMLGLGIVRQDHLIEPPSRLHCELDLVEMGDAGDE